MLYPYIAVLRLARANRWFAGRILAPATLHFGHTLELGVAGITDHPAVSAIHGITSRPIGPVSVVLLGLSSISQEEEEAWLRGLHSGSTSFSEKFYQDIKSKLPDSWSVW